MVEMCKIIEQWKPIIIENIKPYYSISTFGRVFSSATNSFIIPHANENGYLQVSLMTDTGRVFRKVHRLVMLTFCYFTGCEQLQVNHKDCNKLNNNLYNLEWMTAKQNTNHAIINGRTNRIGENNCNASITEAQAIQISNMIIAGYSDDYICNTVGCSKYVIKGIAYGNTWSYLFSPEILKAMLKTRISHYITDDQKNMICKYFSDNIDFNTSVKDHCINALIKSGVIVDERSLRIAKRLYYRYQNPEITSNYKY